MDLGEVDVKWPTGRCFEKTAGLERAAPGSVSEYGCGGRCGVGGVGCNPMIQTLSANAFSDALKSLRLPCFGPVVVESCFGHRAAVSEADTEVGRAEGETVI